MTPQHRCFLHLPVLYPVHFFLSWVSSSLDLKCGHSSFYISQQRCFPHLPALYNIFFPSLHQIHLRLHRFNQAFMFLGWFSRAGSSLPINLNSFRHTGVCRLPHTAYANYLHAIAPLRGLRPDPVYNIPVIAFTFKRDQVRPVRTQQEQVSPTETKSPIESIGLPLTPIPLP